jgi:DNA-binding PadR family transcriptional regulator
MPIQHAVLALLTGGPSHGYELKATFERAIGPQWGELNIGHLHQVLDRLERDGLVVGRLVPQDDRPNKTVYRLTRAGRSELDRWLAAPFTRESGYRDDFFLKLFAASRLGADQLRSIIDVQRRAYLRELAALGELRARHIDDPLIALLVDAAIFHAEANLKVIDTAQRDTAALAKHGERGDAASSKARSDGTQRRPRRAAGS